jgi:hypothetical protein
VAAPAAAKAARASSRVESRQPRRKSSPNSPLAENPSPGIQGQGSRTGLSPYGRFGCPGIAASRPGHIGDRFDLFATDPAPHGVGADRERLEASPIRKAATVEL